MCVFAVSASERTINLLVVIRIRKAETWIDDNSIFYPLSNLLNGK